MKLKQLNALGTFKNGLNFSKETAQGKGCKILGVGDFGNNVYVSTKDLEEISDEYVKEDDLIHDNDIIFVRSNGNKALVGRVLLAKNIQENICFSGFCIRFRPDSSIVDPEFLFYMLKSAYCKKQYTPSQQTNITNLSQDRLGAVFVPLLENPDVENEYVKILSLIDRRIEMNQMVTSELETMVKTIYDYWFVQFDFPDENGKPYNASGGKMVWNDVLKSDVPIGWKVRPLSDLMNVYTDGVNPQNMGDQLVEHYSIPAYDENRYPAFEKGSSIESGKYRVYTDAILVSKLNPQFKRIWDPICVTQEPICSTEFLVCRPTDKGLRTYLFSVLNSDGYYGFMVKNATSSTGSRKRIKPDVALTYQLCVPERKIIGQFTQQVSPMIDKMKSLIIQNQELKELRDWLLPMLMNGQATIGYC